MAKETIYQDKVFEACKRVMARSLPLTTRNVRDEIGGGSFTTLVPILNEFRANLRTESQIRNKLPPPPPELDDLTKKMTQELWVKLRLIVDKEIKDIHAKHELQVTRLQKELEETREEIAGQNSEITKLEEFIKALELDLTAQKKKEGEREGQLQLLIKQHQQKEMEIKNLLERAVRAESKSLKQKDAQQ